ncbi:hypothetical protein D3C87_1660630 [compost metagenome]
MNDGNTLQSHYQEQRTTAILKEKLNWHYHGDLTETSKVKAHRALLFVRRIRNRYAIAMERHGPWPALRFLLKLGEFFPEQRFARGLHPTGAIPEYAPRSLDVLLQTK